MALEDQRRGIGQMACPLHSQVSIRESRKKPVGWFNGKPSYYAEETWVSSLDQEVKWGDEYSARVYGKCLHGELHGEKTIEDCLKGDY